MIPLGNFDVSRETKERLDIYAAELKKWNPRINLVSKATLNDVWDRHFLDSAQLTQLIPPSARHLADFGSGGGFPGLVTAILAAEFLTSLQVTLVESDQRKCAFLRAVIRNTSVKANVISERIEDVPSLEADVISARALAELSKLFELSEGHLTKNGVMLFHKGKNWKYEIEAARRSWMFDYDVVKSMTSEPSVILRISGVTRA